MRSPGESPDAPPVVAATGVSCEDVADLLPAVTDGSATPSPAERAHIDQCLHCQAELVHYRRMLRVLHALSGDRMAPPPGALAAVIASLQEVAEARALHSLRSGRRAAYLGGVLVATAASAAGALVWATRRRVELAS